MLTLPNLLSFIRIPLAFIFLVDSVPFRLAALILAAVSDFFDGYLARRYGQISRLGIILDIFSDRFFVFFIIGIFLYEQLLTPWELAAMLARDFAFIFNIIYMACMGVLGQHQIHALRWGKVTTVLQIVFILGLTLKITIPPLAYVAFVITGVLAGLEFYSETPPAKA